MTDERKEQAALFALGLLDEQERGGFLSALAADGELSVLLDEYHATMAVVALSPELREPPAALRQSILNFATGVVPTGVVPTGVVPTSEAEELSEAPFLPEVLVPPPVELTVPDDLPVADRSAAPVNTVPMRPHSTMRHLPWLVAACLALGCGILFFRVVALQKENARIVAEKGVEYLRIAVLESKAAALPAISARVAWNPGSGSGILETAALPDQGAEKSYQLWIFEKDNPAPVSAGIFDPAVNPRVVFRPERAVENAVAFAVSVEVAGGRPQPEGEVVLLGTMIGG